MSVCKASQRKEKEGLIYDCLLNKLKLVKLTAHSLGDIHIVTEDSVIHRMYL